MNWLVRLLMLTKITEAFVQERRHQNEEHNHASDEGGVGSAVDHAGTLAAILTTNGDAHGNTAADPAAEDSSAADTGPVKRRDVTDGVMGRFRAPVDFGLAMHRLHACKQAGGRGGGGDHGGGREGSSGEGSSGHGRGGGVGSHGETPQQKGDEGSDEAQACSGPVQIRARLDGHALFHRALTLARKGVSGVSAALRQTLLGSLRFGGAALSALLSGLSLTLAMGWSVVAMLAISLALISAVFGVTLAGVMPQPMVALA
jgi:hypothetical protein